VYIRENKTKNKKTGETYIKHQLVESVRVNGKPSQRLIMNLGRLDLPRLQWKKLAHAIEHQLTGQVSLLDENDKHFEDMALILVSNNELSNKIRMTKEKMDDSQTDDIKYLPIDPGSVFTEKTRSIGPELVCHNTWELLAFDQILKDSGFTKNQRGIAKALIFGRLISPGSERHTIEWYRKRSALSEIPGHEVNRFDKNVFYETSDKLYENKDRLEVALYKKQQSLFPGDAHTVFLYDLTNTYMEGNCLGNKLAKRGHCKSKRTDCPLITLSMIARNDGTPVASHIYKGNQSEPETLTDVLDRLDSMFGYDSPQLPLEKPTLVMDRGIATHDNVARMESRGYPYVVITREDHTDEYLAEFEKARETFTYIDKKKRKLSAYGDENNVYVKKIEMEGSKTCRVLCFSEGKARKETAIAGKKETRFVTEIEGLSQFIQKGRIKNIDKINTRLGKKLERHKTIAERYVITLVKNEAGQAQRIEITRKNKESNPCSGCYIIDSTHKELDEVETWKLYMTLSHIEKSFRSMKDKLGIRPVYHQNDQRTSAHLFITVLAYHILSAIENRLSKQGDTRQWSTLRDVLSTHTRNTVAMRDKDGNTHHYRTTGKPEDVHYDIYKKLGIKDPTITTVSIF